MHKHRRVAALLLLAVLLSGCNWPLSHLESEPLAAAGTSGPNGETLSEPDDGPVMALLSPLITPDQVATLAAPMASTATTTLEKRRIFSGQNLRFDLPAGYQVLESIDGGCFLYREPGPGFLILYPQAGESGEELVTLLNATTGMRHSEPPLEVDLGGLTFVGLFVETESGSRLFLAAADGWVLIVEGPGEDWLTLAAGFNQVLRSLSFEEDF